MVEARSAAITVVRSGRKAVVPALLMVEARDVVSTDATRLCSTTGSVWVTEATADVSSRTAIDVQWPTIIASNMVDLQFVFLSIATSVLCVVECAPNIKPKRQCRQ
ncbi:hypothetical protein PC129_g10877 [Phytophthora cactorum]|uniref:Uncharacterized protein n=1 Tax=Phytophthora cactorum TaxID=29920 RepID=A0A329S1D2_9STRA|nr:hypothetical protein Pcac1_g18424 [Phytophthora cactorum]KAG3111167.1 hypothetical protein PI125_g9374 [Phytophthora idaei]KAG2821218.1 hypothetical protein PC112_g11463 [Phytophthora cactorum]KAG2825770.1 hypothetical protein PC111_g9249 [Phytophthora cactorum]KAG2856494.1 hypothetical protein PC113_g11524 [Phytophthora cactorum]